MCLAKTVEWNGMPCKSSETSKPTPDTGHIFSGGVPHVRPKSLQKGDKKHQNFTSFNPSNLRSHSFPPSTGRPLWHRVGDSSYHHEILEKNGRNLRERPSPNSQHRDIETICGPLNSSLTSASGVSSFSWFFLGCECTEARLLSTNFQFSIKSWIIPWDQWLFPSMLVPPVIIHFNGVVHYKPMK